jgi:hypothetical protein
MCVRLGPVTFAFGFFRTPRSFIDQGTELQMFSGGDNNQTYLPNSKKTEGDCS